MSLLADLLSKKGSAEATEVRDIPPTLSRSHEAPAQVRSLKSRYVVMAALSVATLAIGIVAVTQSGKLIQFLNGTQPQIMVPVKPAPAPLPVEPKATEATKPVAPPMAATPEKPLEPEVAEQVVEPKGKTKRKLTRHRAIPRAVPAPLAEARMSTPPAVKEAVAGKVDTSKRDAYLYVANSAEQAGDWRLALANYRKAQKLDPDNHVIMNNAAAALNNLGMFDDAINEAKQALGKKPEYAPAMVNAAIAYSSKGNSQEALRLFSEATIADPGNRSLVINLAIQQERAGRLEEALLTYRPLADDGDPLAIFGLGRIYEHKGNRNDAMRMYRLVMTNPAAHSTTKKEAKSRISRFEE